MGQEGRDLRRPHLSRVAPAVEEDKAADPGDVDLLSPKAVVPPAKTVPNLIEQPWLEGELGLDGEGRRVEQSDLQSNTGTFRCRNCRSDLCA